MVFSKIENVVNKLDLGINLESLIKRDFSYCTSLPSTCYEATFTWSLKNNDSQSAILNRVLVLTKSLEKTFDIVNLNRLLRNKFNDVWELSIYVYDEEAKGQ